MAGVDLNTVRELLGHAIENRYKLATMIYIILDNAKYHYSWNSQTSNQNLFFFTKLNRLKKTHN
jgi:hypothetical protein